MVVVLHLHLHDLQIPSSVEYLSHIHIVSFVNYAAVVQDKETKRCTHGSGTQPVPYRTVRYIGGPAFYRVESLPVIVIQNLIIDKDLHLSLIHI